MNSPALSPEDRKALDGLTSDMQRVFGGRVHSIAAYGLDSRAAHGGPLHALALVERLTFEDLAACAPLARAWHGQGLDVPLLLEREEFQRTLDVFPLEYGDIIARHVVIFGSDPFVGVSVSPSDLRRAIEQQAKSHLIHLREGFLETSGDPQAVGRLVSASAPAFRTLLTNIARLAGDEDHDVASVAERLIGIPAPLVRELFSAGAGNAGSIVDPTALLARCIEASERVWEYVDTWR
jgi:hypothetical protein